MNTNQSTRPYGLPPELPDPPQPPAGHRGVYRGMVKPSVHFYVGGDEKWCAMSNGHHGFGGHYIEWVPLRRTPEGVAPVPEPAFDIADPSIWTREQRCAVDFIAKFPNIEDWTDHAKAFKASWEAENPTPAQP